MAGTRYPNLRKALAGSHRRLPDRAIERVVARQGLEAGAIEDFLSDVGNFVAGALPVVGGVVGSIIPGVGTAIGTGVGALAGGALHAAIGSGQQPAPAQPPPAQPPPAQPATTPIQQGVPGQTLIAGMPLPPQVLAQIQAAVSQALQSGLVAGPIVAGGGPTPVPVPVSAPASSQQAIALLLQALTHPQTLQSLLAMLLGGAGAPTVPVGNTPVPVSAFTNLLSTLASQASEAYNQERGLSGYAEGTYYGSGPFASPIDLASPDARAGALLNLLRESADNGALRAQRRQRLATLAQALRVAA